MQNTSLSRTEGDGSISVCAQVTSPMGGQGIPVAVTFTRSGQSPGTHNTQTSLSQPLPQWSNCCILIHNMCFHLATETKTFSAGGERVQCLSISNEDDQLFEDATTFTVTLSSTQNRVTATGTTTVTIMDSDGMQMMTIEQYQLSFITVHGTSHRFCQIILYCE